METVLTIAGSDSIGGAGIQADIKTITCNGAYAMSAITAMTAQNTLGVKSIQESTPEFLADQIDAVFTDIVPNAVKIGMVSNPDLIKVIAEKLKFYRAKNIVIDPVMVATSGSALMKTDAINTLWERLVPMATVITPNIIEAGVLCGFEIKCQEDMLRAAEEISKHCDCGILIKGGHLVCDATDLLYHNGKSAWFSAPRIENPNTHGTGCTLSSAIACGLAAGLSLSDSISSAKKYLTGAIAAMLNLGKGHGPLEHTYNI